MTGRPVLVLALVLVAALLAACTGSDSSGDRPADPITEREALPRVPAGTALVGAAVSPALPVDGPQASAYRSFDDTVGAHTTIAHVFRTFDEPVLPPDVDALLDDGRYPMISWNGSDIPGIAAGRHDDVLRAAAEDIRDAGVPVFLRFRWEMDRPNLREAVQSPETYVAAWRRARAVFASVGVPNAAWVWCPTASGFAEGGDAAAFYPGDDQVDWLCVDAYPDRELQPLAELMAPFEAWAAGHDKPVMIGEFGVPRTADDAGRAAWLEAAGQWLEGRPGIGAVVYFSLDVNADAPVLQFGLDPGTEAASAYGALVRDLSTAGAPS